MNLQRAASAATRLVVLWIALSGAVAVWRPPLFLPIREWVPWLLALIMFGMGMTLTGADFRRILIAPRAVAVGVVSQFAVMPLAGLALARAFGMPWELATGMLLVGVCPSGTASNVVTYLAGADVALSVTMTAVNTMLAPILTPLLLKLLAGQHIQVEAARMFLEILRVVVVPTLAGVLINTYARGFARRVAPACPLLSVVGIVLIVSFIIANNAGRLSEFGPVLAAGVALHNAAGYGAGYWLARAVRLPESQCRAIAFEIGIQNSALDIQLATKFYPTIKAMTLPGAFFSVWQNITGPGLASWWAARRK